MSSAGIIHCDNVLDDLSAKLFLFPNLYSCTPLVWLSFSTATIWKGLSTSSDPLPNAASFKALRKKQDQEPVTKQELLAIEGFYYNGERNILRGLTSESLKFGKILNQPSYRCMLGKSEDFLDIVEDYRNLRNQIHLPRDFVEAPHLAQYAGYSLMEVLEKFINEEIVACNNKLIAKWNLNGASSLVPLNLF